MIIDEYYEIFAINAYGSDVLEKDTLEQALECAEEWSMSSIDTDVIVNKVTRVRVKAFRNGGEVA